MDTKEILTILENYKNEIVRINNLINNLYSYQEEYMNVITSENRIDKFRYGKVKTLREITETYDKLVSTKNNILKEIYKIVSENKNNEEVKNFWIDISSEIVDER